MSDSITLVPPSDENCSSYGELLDRIMDGNSPSAMDAAAAVLDTVENRPLCMSHQEVLATVSAQITQSPSESHFQIGFPSSSSELSLVSLTKSMSPAINVDSPESILPSSNINAFPSNLDKIDLSDQKTKSKSPFIDGYNWRKYGQKQVRNSESIRGYYRCTYENCHAKKVYFYDPSGCTNEVAYKGAHNHDPPRKVKDRKASSESFSSLRENETAEHPIKKEPMCATPEQVEHTLSKTASGAGIDALQEKNDDPHSKRRKNEPKIVVRAAADSGTAIDGYRWRKYGQKQVKGSPNPRSYYKCTSIDCPARKHMERSVQDTTAMIVTYERNHNHDMPVPKMQHIPASSTHLIAAAVKDTTAASEDTNSSDSLTYI